MSAFVLTPRTADEQFDRRPLLRNTGLGMVASLVAVLLIRAIAVSISSVPQTFKPLQAGAVVGLTILGLVAAAASALLINRMSATPLATFRRIVPIALAVSFGPDIALWANGGEARAATVLPLMLMHIIVAAVAYSALTRSANSSS